MLCLLTLQIREKEADIDALITPIEDMYSLLLRYEVRQTFRCGLLPTCYSLRSLLAQLNLLFLSGC